jgi:hypothetical protein
MAVPQYFQWQNEFLCKTIYPMRETKLRDFLVFYAEVDIWKQYKGKNVAALGAEVKAFQSAQASAAQAAYKEYKDLRTYFLTADARATYAKKYNPLDEAELTEINNFHALFVDSWPKDIRGERGFVEMQIASWTNHRNLHRDWVKSRKRRLDAMDTAHPRYALETKELQQKEGVTLPMADQELDQLRAFLATYDKIEQRKLDWYKRQKSDPNFKTPEEEFMTAYQSDQPITVHDIAVWKIEEYKSGLAKKNQYELLEEIHQRFQKEPTRFPFWLQYMVVHFSGMRYASAHSSWADPKDLLTRLRAPMVEAEVKNLDDAAVEKLSQEKITAYASAGSAPRPKLANAPEKEWKDRIGWHMPNVKAIGVKTKRLGLTNLRKDEDAYEVKCMTTQEVLNILLSKKKEFPAWAWKEIVKLTPLRVTEVTDPSWEKLTPQEEQERFKPEYNAIRAIMDAWINYDASAWREEHGRTHELIVTRAVCNETAEHVQHIRGHLPPGGLTPKPAWYLKNESENTIPGTPRPFYKHPKAAEDYVNGASILWLRFVNKEPNAWQIAKQVETKDGVGLLPAGYGGKGAGVGATNKASGKGKPATPAASPWEYKVGGTVTRSRTVIGTDGSRVVQPQWLRWIHEATVVEVAETPDGLDLITYETALPDDDKGTSCIGIFKQPLAWHLSDGTEDEYNRSFVGFVPEGQVPTEHLKVMLDWNKILRK